MANQKSKVVLSLSGKRALITGGSRGIGAAAVRLFAQAGAQVAFNYVQAAQEATALVNELGAAKTFAIQQELASVAQGRELVAKAIAVLGGLDILVVNHGIWPPNDAPISSMSETQWRRTMDVNLDSVLGLVSASVAQMKKQPRTESQPSGHIVLVSSTAGQRGEAFHADYAVTKGAIISLTRSLSTELAPDGIYVNCVAPGWVSTDMSASALNDPVKGQQIFAKIPLCRVATPEEIAGPILFLCTKYAGFMSGSIVSVNGGAVLA